MVIKMFNELVKSKFPFHENNFYIGEKGEFEMRARAITLKCDDCRFAITHIYIFGGWFYLRCDHKKGCVRAK